MKNNNTNTLALLALIVVLLSLISFGVTLYKFNQFNEQITGYASGYVNLTISSSVSINLTDDRVNWSSGTVNVAQGNATLITYGTTAQVTRGSWSTAGVNSMILRNDGNVNCSLKIQSGNSSTTFFQSLSGGNQSYQINITNKEANSCWNLTTIYNLTTFVDVNITSPGTNFCSNFTFGDTQDEIYIDIALTVPYDANSTRVGSELTDTLTITCT